MTPEVAVACGDRLGESPLWDGGTLRWLDLLEPRLHALRDGRHEVLPLAVDPPLGAIVPGPRGSLALVHRGGVAPLDPATGAVGPPWGDPEGARAGTAWNDAKVAPDGALWLGSYDLAERDPRGALWRWPPGGRAELVDAGFAVSNGPAFSPDGATAYFNDSAGRRTLAYRRDAAGRWAPEELIRHDAVPDGLTVDAEGGLWIALWGGGAVARHAPDGRALGRVALPCPQVTSCAFGGPRLSTLFVTTAWEGDDRARHPEAGHLFAVETDATGREEPAFTPG